MIRKMLIALAILGLGSPALADVGVFENTHDIGDPTGHGYTMGLSVGGGTDIEYVLTGSGSDIWGQWDQFHMAYNLVEGDVRLSADMGWHITSGNEWAKYGVMFRDATNGTDQGGAVHYSTLTRRDNNLIRYAGRKTTDAGSWDSGYNADTTGWTLGLQRVTVANATVLQSLVDKGSGWELIGQTINPNLPNQIMAGLAVTSHNNADLVQVKASNVSYQYDGLGLIGAPTVDASTIDQCSDVPGFKIRVRKFEQNDWRHSVTDGTDADAYVKAGQLMDGTIAPWVLDLDIASSNPPASWNPLEGVRVDPVVNLNQDDGDAGAFGAGTDSHYPGIDLYKAKSSVSGYADDADGEDGFAVEVIACIYLTEGLHILGANSDDGTLIEIGGQEIGRSEAWKGASNRDFQFVIATEGFYNFRALNFEGDGGANLELHEVFLDGSRILLGATDEQGAFIGSPVYAPEPATIALLGLGGLSLIRRKRS
jgi:hypothetical protein